MPEQPPRLVSQFSGTHRLNYLEDELVAIRTEVHDYDAAEDDHGGAPLAADLTRAAVGRVINHDTNGAD